MRGQRGAGAAAARGGGHRATGIHGVTGPFGASASLIPHVDVFVLREDEAAVSWLLTEAALIPPADRGVR